MLWTSQCLNCRRPSKKVICINCWDQVIKTPDPNCSFCSFPLSKQLCHFCESHPLKYPHISFGPYEGMLKNLLFQLKYHGRKDFGVYIGEAMGRFLLNQNNLKLDLLIPVPLHRDKEKERGYNQSYLLSKGMGKVLRIPVIQAVKRVKYTAPFYELSLEERKNQLEHTFEVNSNKLKNQSIGLVDDILTTGSTINAITELLEFKHPQSILSLSIGRTLLK